MTNSTAAPVRLAYDRAGRGEPLLLLHGIGLSRRSWDPVLPLLAELFDVIAVDLAGHGESAWFADRAGSPVDHALAVEDLLDQLGLDTVHMAGNSLGGWVALELAKAGRARSVTALSPGGLWGRHAPVFVKTALRQARLNARIAHRLAPAAPRSRWARTLFMAQMSGRPTRVPYAVANQAVGDMATAHGFRGTIRAAERTGFGDGTGIDVPVTIAFGTRDRVLPPVVTRRHQQLPAHTRWMRILGAGHLAMVDDPRAVAALLLQVTGSAAPTEPAATTPR